MTGADYVLLVVLVVSMAVGLWRGFIVEVLSLTVWVAAFWLAVAFGGAAAANLHSIEEAAPRMFLAYAGIFLGTLFLGGVVIWGVDKLLSSTGLSSTDRVLGLGFGLVRGLALGCCGVLLLGFTPLPQESWWRESKLMPAFQTGAAWMASFLPASAANEIHYGPRPTAQPPATPGAET